jgi:hypothetical protein
MNKLDNRFKDGLEDFTSLPSPAVWDAIEASLNDSSRGIKQTVSPHWRWISGAVASIALALFFLPIKQAAVYFPRTAPTPNEKLSAPTPSLVDFSELAVEELSSKGTKEPVSVNPLTQYSLFAWEKNLEADEAEIALNDELLPLVRIQSEWIHEPVKVHVVFTNKSSLERVATITPVQEKSLLSKTAGATARIMGTNIAKFVGNGTVNWETAKIKYNKLALSNKSKTPKINNK